MRLYGAIQKVEPQDDGTVRVHGIATSEAVDDEGEIVRAEAMRVAIPNYMRFPALREMHQLSAAGTTLEAAVSDDGTTRIVAHVVDPIAVAKVKNQVYRGFSIGGRVTQRDPGNPKAITSLILNEISLVDRPANPEAVFDCWKAVHGSQEPVTRGDLASVSHEPTQSTHVTHAKEAFNSPIQVWACGVPDHRHLTKARALKCIDDRVAEPLGTNSAATASAQPRDPAGDGQYDDPGYQADGTTRHPIATDRHIRTSKEKIDRSGPPSAEDGRASPSKALTRSRWQPGRIDRLCADLDWLKDNLQLDRTMEDDTSPTPMQLQAVIIELCRLLNEFATEEAKEMLSNAEGDDRARGIPTMAAEAPGTARIAALLEGGSLTTRKLAAGVVAKAAPTASDQMLMDMAYLACDECLKLEAFSAEQTEHIVAARDQLNQAGAVTVDPLDSDAGTSARLEMLSVVAALLDKRQPAQTLMDIAHECIGKLSDGSFCREIENTKPQLSGETLAQLETAHDHLVAAGAKCEGACTGSSSAAAEDDRRDRGSERGVRPGPVVLAQAQAVAASAEKAALAKVLSEIVPKLERLTKRVDDLARTPLPPLTIAKGTVSVSKQQDSGGSTAGDAHLSPEAIVSAFAKMSKDEQTLTLIKASYANPIRLHGSGTSE
jgi:hypothetical protein